VSKPSIHCLRITISGQVQGVGFRYYTKLQADKLGITGWVRNLDDGRVETCICGSEDQLTRMQTWLKHGPESAKITHFDNHSCDCKPLEGFRIIKVNSI